ncbi:MAG: hypothetical protein IKW39_05125 [Alphaproteobacteria bacterium]|nr:hypothetical protein [Alphaproteobacteria bacterium]
MRKKRSFRCRNGYNFWNGLASVLTYGIYQPQEYKVYCKSDAGYIPKYTRQPVYNNQGYRYNQYNSYNY